MEFLHDKLTIPRDVLCLHTRVRPLPFLVPLNTLVPLGTLCSTWKVGVFTLSSPWG